MTLCRAHDAPGRLQGLFFSKLGRTSLPGHGGAGSGSGTGTAAKRDCRGSPENGRVRCHHSSSPGSLGQIASANRGCERAWENEERKQRKQMRRSGLLDVNSFRKAANGCTEAGPTEKAAASRTPKTFGAPPIPRQADHDPTPRSLNKLQCRQDTGSSKNRQRTTRRLEQHAHLDHDPRAHHF